MTVDGPKYLKLTSEGDPAALIPIGSATALCIDCPHEEVAEPLGLTPTAAADTINDGLDIPDFWIAEFVVVVSPRPKHCAKAVAGVLPAPTAGRSGPQPTSR